MYVAAIFAFVATIGILIAGVRWRDAFIMALLVGFIQDPIRKMVPEQPVILVMLFAMMMVIATAGAMSRLGAISLTPLTLGSRNARIVMSLFVMLVTLQAMMGFVRFGSMPVAVIGLISYLSPIPAVWVASHFARSELNILRFLKTYALFALVVAVSLYLSQWGYNWTILQQVGEGLIIFDPVQGLMIAHTGFMRGPEIAAWHVGAAACFLVIVAMTMQRVKYWLVAAPLVILLLSSGLFTGRRKLIVVFAVFLVIYLAMMIYYRQRSGTRALVLGVGIAVMVSIGSLVMAPERSSYNPYVARGETVFGDAWERFNGLGIASISWAINSAGYLGIGAGATGQGSQHFGGASDSVRGAAEGGLGKIVVELGVPGLILAVMIVVIVARNVRRVISASAASNPRLLRINLGLVSFCAANIPVFIGASQIYGDPFVLFILGSCLGFVLATPKLIQNQLLRRQQMPLPVTSPFPPNLSRA